MKYLWAMILPGLLLATPWDELRQVKYLIVNGNLQQAQRKLQQLDTWEHPHIEIIQERYLATLLALQGEWASARQIFAKQQSLNFYDKTCPLQLLTRMALSRKDGLKWEFQNCFAPHVRNGGIGDYYWAMAMAKLPTERPYPPHLKYGQDLASTIRWAKLALFQRREQNFLDYRHLIPSDIERHPRMREIMGFLHYRLKQWPEALTSLEGLDLANAHNIRGNIALREGKRPQAREHFQTALLKKPDSLNALRRSLPLDWSERDFATALNKIRLTFDLGPISAGGKIFKAALLTEVGEHQKAVEILLILPQVERKQYSRIVEELLSFNYLMLKEPRKSLVAARTACLHMNELSCAMLAPLSRWDNWGTTLRRKDPIPSPHGIDLEQLTGENPPEENAFTQEVRAIDQEDIQQWDEISADPRDALCALWGQCTGIGGG